MKNLAITLAFVVCATAVSAQSESFQKFRDKFGYADDVHSFRTNGFFLRTVLTMAGEDEAKHALRHIGKIRLIVVPKAAFTAEQVTVSGYKEVLRSDGYDQIMNVREDGSDVTVYERGVGDAENRYMVLVDEKSEVVLIEVNGYVDREYLKNLFVINRNQKS